MSLIEHRALQTPHGDVTPARDLSVRARENGSAMRGGLHSSIVSDATTHTDSGSLPLPMEVCRVA